MSENGHSPEADVNLVVGIPSTGLVRVEWAAELHLLAMPNHHKHMLRIVTGEDVVTARNTLASETLRVGAQYLFFLDDDVLVPNQTIRRLIYQMEQNPDWDLLTGIVCTKTVPPEPCIYKGKGGPYWGWRFGEQFEIDTCGMACCMIRADAFQKVDEPWFEWVDSYEEGRRAEEGEDINFCRKLREAGGKLMADGAILCGHLGDDGKMYALDQDSAPIKNAEQSKLDQHTFYVPEPS